MFCSRQWQKSESQYKPGLSVSRRWVWGVALSFCMLFPVLHCQSQSTQVQVGVAGISEKISLPCSFRDSVTLWRINGGLHNVHSLTGNFVHGLRFLTLLTISVDQDQDEFQCLVRETAYVNTTTTTGLKTLLEVISSSDPNPIPPDRELYDLYHSGLDEHSATFTLAIDSERCTQSFSNASGLEAITQYFPSSEPENQGAASHSIPFSLNNGELKVATLDLHPWRLPGKEGFVRLGFLVSGDVVDDGLAPNCKSTVSDNRLFQIDPGMSRQVHRLPHGQELCVDIPPPGATDFILATVGEPYGHISCPLLLGRMSECGSTRDRPLEPGINDRTQLCLNNANGFLDNSQLFLVQTLVQRRDMGFSLSSFDPDESTVSDFAVTLMLAQHVINPGSDGQVYDLFHSGLSDNREFFELVQDSEHCAHCIGQVLDCQFDGVKDCSSTSLNLNRQGDEGRLVVAMSELHPWRFPGKTGVRALLFRPADNTREDGWGDPRRFSPHHMMNITVLHLSRDQAVCLSVPDSPGAEDIILVSEADPNGHRGCSLNPDELEQCDELGVKKGIDRQGRFCLRNDDGKLDHSALIFTRFIPMALVTELLSRININPEEEE